MRVDFQIMDDPREILTRPAQPPDLTLTYGPDPEHLIDVRLPAQWPAPVVVVMHGGFWRSEFDRTHTGPMATALAASGYVVAVPEYRRTGGPGGGWPGTFQDVAGALTAVPELLASYSAGPVTWVGHSAGGHLALWAACSVPEASVAKVISLAGCVDLSLCSTLGLDDGATDLLMGGGPESVPDRYAVADPALLEPPGVAVTLIHGTRDDRVPIEVSRSYAACRPAELLELPGVEHFGLIDPLSSAWGAVLAAVEG
jgi:acetyl esterase/lipase